MTPLELIGDIFFGFGFALGVIFVFLPLFIIVLGALHTFIRFLERLFDTKDVRDYNSDTTKAEK